MKWARGIVEWIEGEDAYLSVVFTWDLDHCWQRASWLYHSGYRVHVGGPALHVRTGAREDMRMVAPLTPYRGRHGGTAP